MRVALTHNLRVNACEEEAEFDTPETIAAVEGALSRAGHRVEPFDVTGPASRLVARLEAFAPDIVFNLAEGHRGRARRAFYPALFEELGMASTGSDAYTLCVTHDKALTKERLRACGIPSPNGRLVTRATMKSRWLDDVAFPAIVKPNFEGSSKGIDQNSVVENSPDLLRLLDSVLDRYPEGALVETFVSGRDVRVVHLDGLPRLPIVEMTIHAAYPRRYDIVDYRLAHIDASMLHRHAPATLDEETASRLHDFADRIVAAFELRDVGAFDFRVGPEGQVSFLSATAIPSFAEDGGLFVATAAAGISPDETVLTVLGAAARRLGLTRQFASGQPRSRGRRTNLRIGLAFNMKRIDSHDGDDREAEYDSPDTIQAVASAIESHGHTVIPIEATPEFPRSLMASNVDIVFNIAEGMVGRNREAQVPSLCELIGVPYTGSDPASLSICLDKALAKRLLTEVDTPAFQVLVTGREKLRSFRYPVIVKPNQEGTSKGISSKSICDAEPAVRAVAQELIKRYGQPALVEEYIFGKELTVGLLGERRPRVLPPMEVVFLRNGAHTVYDYTCKQKWQDHVRYQCPADLTKDELRAVERTCRTTFMALGCRDVARIDLRLSPDGGVYVLEVNPLPGLTPDYSDLCLIANGAKIDYRTLIGDILSGAIKRWQTAQRAGGSVMRSNDAGASASA